MSKKVSLYLMGGLGNVLFQINYANNLKTQGFDVTLNVFLLKNNFITKKILGWSNHNTLSNLSSLGLISSFRVEDKASIGLFFGFLSKLIKKKIFNCQFFGLISPDFEKLKATHIFGYFHINNTINLEFVSSTKRAIEKWLCKPNSICVRENLEKICGSWVIHIRGGDYKLDPNFAIDIDYYNSATNGKNNFYVVTNDRKYSESVMLGLNLNFKFVDSNDSLEDFIVLAFSEKKILANSTFSWWAAEFGKSDSLVIQRDPFYTHVEWNPHSLCNRQKVGRVK